MRIGIITQPLRNNYGGLLQNYALQQLLREFGHEPVTLDWCGGKSSWRRFAYRVKRWMLWFLRKSPKPQYQLSQEESRVISRNTVRFVSQYITRTQRIHTSKGFFEESKRRGLQVLITGSDQVWRPRYAEGHLLDMFLLFSEGLDVKRIAYAVSLGTDQWEIPPKQTALCRKLAAKFDLVTVREHSALSLCQKYLGVEAIHLLDPTMLHEKSLYEEMVMRSGTPPSKGNLFHYMLDPSSEKFELIDKVARGKNLKPFTVMPLYQDGNRSKSNVKREIDKCVFPGVEEWLRAFMDAEMVLCDSFHGCVFSIIFNKPFWVVGNEKRGNTRFVSLLNTFGLQDRLIPVPDEVDFYATIDWDRINALLAEKRSFSRHVLLDALNCASE